MTRRRCTGSAVRTAGTCSACRTTLPDARTVCLEQNFRSRQRILALANAVRPSAGGVQLRLRSERDGGPRPRLLRCHDAAAEARTVVDSVLESHEQGRPLKTQAVLMRAGHHSDLLEIELTARHVPFVKYGGLKFLEAAHVKDFIAAVRLLDNPLDEIAWYPAAAPARRHRAGQGPRAAGRAAPARARYGYPASRHRGRRTSRHPYGRSQPPSTRWPRLACTHRSPTRAERVLDLLRPLLTARYPDHAARLSDLDRLVGAAAQSPTLADYVASLTLDPPASTSDLAGPPHLDEDYLVLSTVHSAKGLEWDSVHVINVIDGAFPSDMALTSSVGLLEEQRLFYVAATRARDELSIYTPLRLPHHRRARDDRHSYAPQSRFLDEAALATMDIKEHRPATPIVRTAAPVPRVDMPTLDELWA